MFNKQIFLLLGVVLLCATTYASPDSPEGEPIPITRGTTTEQVEEAARQSKTWSQRQSYLINNNPNVANASDVSDAFDLWNS